MITVGVRLQHLQDIILRINSVKEETLVGNSDQSFFFYRHRISSKFSFKTGSINSLGFFIGG